MDALERARPFEQRGRPAAAACMGRVHGERHRGRPVITEESKRDSRRGPISLSLEVDEGREVRRWGRWTTQGLARQTGTAVARTGKPPGKHGSPGGWLCWQAWPAEALASSP